MEEEIITPEEEVFDYNKLRYILGKDGFVCHVSLGGLILCDLGECTEYTGEVPEGYETIEEWFDNELERINAWKIVDGNLVFDAAKYEELKAKWEQEEIDNSYVRHCDIYGMQEDLERLEEINANQYGTRTKTGTIITLADAIELDNQFKITNINPYKNSSVDLKITGKNLLPNEATSQTIADVSFTQNEDRTINIDGTATADIEYNIAGSSENTIPILVLKKGMEYYLNSNDFILKMYHYDGTDRTEVYSGTGGEIKFTDNQKEVTQIVLSIANGTTIEDKTLSPQLETGVVATDYEMFKTKNINIDFSEYIEEPLYPSETLFPSGTLFTTGTVIDYVWIKDNAIYISVNGIEEEIEETDFKLYTGNNSIYTIQDNELLVVYKSKDLAVDSLEFLQGKATTNNKFRILEDGSIEAHDGNFSGNIYADNVYLADGGKVVGADGMLSTIYVPGTMMTSGGGIGSRPMGFYLGYSSATSGSSYITYRDYMLFEFTIPKGFVIKSAYVYVNHMPIIYKTYGTTKCTGYTRAMGLYRATSMTGAKITYDQSRGQYANSGTFQSISGALGSGGFTGSTSGLTRKKSIDLKSYIYTSTTSEKYNVIKLQSTATAPAPKTTGNMLEDEIPLREYTGSVNATLVITGYTKFE